MPNCTKFTKFTKWRLLLKSLDQKVDFFLPACRQLQINFLGLSVENKCRKKVTLADEGFDLLRERRPSHFPSFPQSTTVFPTKKLFQTFFFTCSPHLIRENNRFKFNSNCTFIKYLTKQTKK